MATWPVKAQWRGWRRDGPEFISPVFLEAPAGQTRLDWDNMPIMEQTENWFAEARFGLMIHYGLYSLLERGEWVMNREGIAPRDYAHLAKSFTAKRFDADKLADLAVSLKMRYLVFTTMHHEGFRLYDTDLSKYNSVKTCGRDLVAEVMAAAKKRGLRVGLYHSLNNWYDQPDAVEALEDSADYERFIAHTFARLEELAARYPTMDVFWYDGWWPFDSFQWQAEKMNQMIRKRIPNVLFNGRNGLPGDFATPEGHLTPPTPWRPWEGCMPWNQSWGYHRGDKQWKSAGQIVDLLATAACGRGNLLLNVGPRGQGDLPPENLKIAEQLARWMDYGHEALFDTELWTMDLRQRGQHRADWNSHGRTTVRGNNLYWLIQRWPGKDVRLGGLESKVLEVTLLGPTPQPLAFTQKDGMVSVRGLPAQAPDAVCPLLRMVCDTPPRIYQTGGMRVPKLPHPHYDPCESDLIPGSLPG